MQRIEQPVRDRLIPRSHAKEFNLSRVCPLKSKQLLTFD